MDEEQYISERYRNLVEMGIDPEEAYFRATAEFYSGHQVDSDQLEEAPPGEGLG